MTLLLTGLVLLIGYLTLLLLLPSDQRPPLAMPDLVRAAERCADDDGQLEVVTDVHRRPIMVTCLVQDR